MSGTPGEVTVRTVEYLVTIWPRVPRGGPVVLVVADRGNGRWAVEQTRDHGFPKVVLTRSGQWTTDRRGDPACRFSLGEALDAARPLIRTASRQPRHAPGSGRGEPMTVVEGPRPGSWGGTRMPSADDVLLEAIGLVLTGAGLPEAAILSNGLGTGTGSWPPLWRVRRTRAAVTWYEDGKSARDTDAPAGKLRDCEQALRRAGFHVEYTTETTGGCLLAWRRTRTR